MSSDRPEFTSLLKVEQPGNSTAGVALRGVTLPVSRDADNPIEKRAIESQTALVIALVDNEAFSPGIGHEETGLRPSGFKLLCHRPVIVGMVSSSLSSFPSSSIRDLAESLVPVNGDFRRTQLGELQTSSSPKGIGRGGSEARPILVVGIFPMCSTLSRLLLGSMSNEISEKPEIESSLALVSSILLKVLNQNRSAMSEGERNEAMTDLELKKNVETELSWEPSVNAAEIGVGVKDGVVSLTGRIESYWERSVAERATLRVSGVKGVANELEIRLPFANVRSDEDIARAAINRLDWSVTVPKDRVKVKASQGWLTLEGTLDWQFQREAAADAVRNLMGVKGLTNQIDVKPQVSKTEVKSMIEAALKRSAEVDANRITVQTEGDGVILRGTVRSWSEREEAQQAAWRAPGVRSVDNRITIGAAAAAGV